MVSMERLWCMGELTKVENSIENLVIHQNSPLPNIGTLHNCILQINEIETAIKKLSHFVI